MVFKYLLVNSVPVGRGSAPGRFTAGRLWLEDLKAEAASIREVGGGMIAALPLVERLDVRRSGSFEVVEFAPEEEGFEYAALPWYGSWSEYLRARPAIRRALGKQVKRAAVVKADTSGHPLPLGGLVWTLAGRAGCRRVFAFDGGDLIGQREASVRETSGRCRRTYRRLRNRYLRSRYRRAVQSADLVFTHNDATRRHFQDVWGPHCHQFDRSYVTEEMIVGRDEMASRIARLKSCPGRLRFVSASRLIPIKALDQAIRAVALARASGDVQLDIFGEGSEGDRLAALVQELGVSEGVRIHPPVRYGPELFERLKCADAMLITNIVPELSRNYLLAMALGLPIVAYANPGSDSLMARSEGGIVVPGGDWRALGRAMAELVADPTTLSRCVEAGPAFAAKTTLNACHRRRAALIAGLLGGTNAADVSRDGLINECTVAECEADLVPTESRKACR